MKKILSLSISLLIAFNYAVKADEGMWLLPLLEKLNMGTMTTMGLKLSAEEIYSINQPSIKDAIVIFGGFCTGEIVSDQGLILTNHHCGYSSIQSHSTTEHNYLKNGFWAMTKAEELANPGLYVTFLVRIEDVSDRINSSLNDKMTEEERAEKIRQVASEIENQATEDTHYTARVQSFYGGNYFYLLVYERFNDVRLVGTPPESIGKYGGDTDNWMWPRHTGDFSVFRVYAGPDGKPSNYSEENIPLKPRHYLPVSIRGIDKGDFAMILGYPGGTTRYMTSFGIDELLNITHPNRIKIRGVKQDIIWEDMMKDEKVRIQYSSKFSRSSNYWKFSIGQSKGLKRLNIKQQKQDLEKKFLQYIQADRKRSKKYGEALNLIEASIKGRSEYVHATQYMNECLRSGSEIISFASRAGRLEQALNEGDEDRISRQAERLKRGAEGFFRDYNPPTDQKVVKAMMKLFAADVKKEHQPGIFTEIEENENGDYDSFVDRMFRESVFAGEEKFLEFLDNPSLEVLENDPAYKAAISINSKSSELDEKAGEFSENLAIGRRLYMAGLMEMQKERIFYPDANFSMRLTYGKVGDYDPMDAVHYKHYTTLKGVMEKEDPENVEFIVEEKLKELYKAKDFGPYGKDGVMPVCFTTDNDITGGNSGSPVINGNGELIGLAFDGNWEAMSGDIAFETELQKCINVDIRYVLFIIDKLAGAGHLVEEMKVVE
ncbi:MAG: S46 family peptidase [Bacteroidales bacterium]|nr:MAG: S46 family peptidase [Bacteroidales bacterium]